MIDLGSAHAAHTEGLVARQAAAYAPRRGVPVRQPTEELMAADPVMVQVAAGERQLLRLAAVGPAAGNHKAKVAGAVVVVDDRPPDIATRCKLGCRGKGPRPWVSNPES